MQTTLRRSQDTRPAQCFGVQHNATGLFFGGFAQDGATRWVVESAAKAMDRLTASAQAVLLAMDDRAVQRKPVSL